MIKKKKDKHHRVQRAVAEHMRLLPATTTAASQEGDSYNQGPHHLLHDALSVCRCNIIIIVSSDQEEKSVVVQEREQPHSVLQKLSIEFLHCARNKLKDCGKAFQFLPECHTTIVKWTPLSLSFSFFLAGSKSEGYSSKSQPCGKLGVQKKRTIANFVWRENAAAR